MGGFASPDVLRRQVEAFFTGLSTGGFAPDLFAPAATFWTSAAGPIPGDIYRRVPAMLAEVFPTGLAFAMDSVIVSENRAAAEVRSHGVWEGDQVYANDYGFFFRFDGAQIAAVAEHFNPLKVSAALSARMQAALAG